MFERIVYQSTACQEFGSLALFRLLTEAQLRNASMQITGHLLFLNGQFTQCFEGPAENVELLWQSLRRDSRHRDIELLVRHTTQERRFPAWSMAFSTYNSHYVHGMQGFFPMDGEKTSPLVHACMTDLVQSQSA
jgi:hypothetical protein